MTTSWSDPAVCAGFDEYADIPEQVLGYRTVFNALELARPERLRVLDYGCGPGKVSERVARRFGKPVLAVDSSATMLDIARRKRPHPLVEYRHISDSLVGLVEDHSMDVAMTCYVFINIGSEPLIRRIVQEVYRTLKPGGSYAILDTNPDTTGVEFSTFRNGAPGRRYRHGEQREVLLRVPGKNEHLVLLDHHWPKEMYLSALRDAGFRSIDFLQPTLSSLPREEVQPPGPPGVTEWRSEWTTPPFIIFKATK
ncbi:class I SAM-dependent methyltransferase [Myxococcus fulvus]|uniref:class I SAM-dependent methyltransferase n=1 Tax=Myxococcus fulvus TaxID=33 RepID=UPI003B9A090E